MTRPLQKKCYKCKTSKDIAFFGVNRSKHDNLASECKECKKAGDKDYFIKNREVCCTRASEWYLNNKDKAIESMKVYGKLWRTENKGKNNTKAANYRASKLKATPKWLSAEDMQDISTEYELASWTSQVMQAPYHVDHIIPLKGRGVCGLHVPWNLQVIPASTNISKGNRHVI